MEGRCAMAEIDGCRVLTQFCACPITLLPAGLWGGLLRVLASFGELAPLLFPGQGRWGGGSTAARR